MIYFVLYTNGQQTFGCFLYLSSVAIEVANANVLGALNLFEVAGHGNATFLGHRHAVPLQDLRIDHDMRIIFLL